MVAKVLVERESLDVGRVALFASGAFVLILLVLYFSGAFPEQSVQSFLENAISLPGYREFLTVNQLLSFGVFQHGGNGSVGYYGISSSNFTNQNVTNATLTGYTCSGTSCNFTIFLDNDNSTKISNYLNFSDTILNYVLYNASDGSLRNVSELGKIGQGSWNVSSSNLNFTLAGGDGFEYGVRDSRPGGSYWLDENGSLYGMVNISNDFIRVGMTERNLTVYNSSNKIIFNASFDDAVKVDGQNLISLYGGGAQNKTVYFFDWASQTWKIWQKESESIVATGGNITYADGYTIHTFTSNGTFNVTSGSGPVEYLVVAGGGGGPGNYGGGGGAGGYLAGTNYTVTPQSYAITVGAGGAGGIGNDQDGTKGSNSTFGTIISNGGGGGDSDQILSSDNNGGSGGGHKATTVRTNGTSGQGYGGGLQVGGDPNYANGGGGGAGEQGNDAVSTSVAGAGGDGLQSSISGVATYYAGGGGGGTWSGGTVGAGGLGGGGSAGASGGGNGVSGTANTGGGGGSASYGGGYYNGGSGGSGIVIIRYNNTHGVPDWLDPRNKQEFKWRYVLSRDAYPNINLTYLVTAHDPFVRTFVDSAQKPILATDFSDNSTWTKNATKVYFTNGYVQIDTTTAGTAPPDRIHRKLPFELSDRSWKVDLDIWLTSGSSTQLGHALVLSDSDQLPWGSNQDSIMISGQGVNSYPKCQIFVGYKDGASAGVQSSAFYNPGTGQGCQQWHYVTVERNSPTRITLSVYSNPERTNLIYMGSDTIPATIDGLSYVQVVHDDVYTNEAGRTQTTRVDNVTLWDSFNGNNVSISFSLPENRTSVTTAEPGLVGYWNLNEGFGLNTSDTSGSGNTFLLGNGTSDSRPVWVSNSSCRFGNCLSFDGGDQVMKNNPSFLSDQQGSVSMWFKYYGTGDTESLFDVTDGAASNVDSWIVYQSTGNILHPALIYNDGSVILNSQIGSAITDTNWHHLVTTSDGSTIRAYLDGTERSLTIAQGSNTGQWFGDLSLNRVTVGALQFDVTAGFDGLVDDVRVYSRPLGLSEVNQLYLTGINQQKPGIYFTKNNATDNEEVLFATTNFKNINHTSFQIFSNQTNFFGFNYTFNSTMNQNFMFALGTMGRMNTTAFNPQNNATQFSNELVESVANSTLTWYDILKGTDFEDDFSRYSTQASADAAWVPTADYMNVSVTNDNLQFFAQNGADRKIYYDFGNNISDSSWVLRFKMRFSNINAAAVNIFFLGISSTTGAANTNQNFIQIGPYSSDSLPHNILAGANVRQDQSTYESRHSDTYVANKDYYVELRRISPTLVDAVWYNDDGYTSVALKRINLTNSGMSSITGLRYLKLNTYVTQTGSHSGTIDDVQFWNGVSYATGPSTNVTFKGLDASQHNFNQKFNYDGGAVGIWRLDEGSGLNATDISGNGNTVPINGATWMSNSSCRYGSCLSFDGTDDHIPVRSDGTGFDSVAFWENKDWTISAWVNRKGTPSPQYSIISWADTSGSNDGWGLELTSGGLVEFGDYAMSTYIYSTSALSVDTWYHVVVRKSGTTIKMFVNGVEQGSKSHTSTFTQGSQEFVIGARKEPGFDRFCKCVLDDIRIYQRAMSDTDIRDHYNHEVTRYYDDFGTAISGKTYKYFGVEDSNTTLQPITPAGTVLHYRFNDNSTIKLTDSSGYGNNGSTVSGPVWAVNGSCKFGGCMYFSGGSDYIDLGKPASLSLPDAMTFAAWVYPIGTGQHIAGNFDSAGFKAQWNILFSDISSGRSLMRFQSCGDSGSCANYLNLIGTSAYATSNQWNHVAVVRDSADGQVRLYVNGIQDANTATSSSNKIASYSNVGTNALGSAGTYSSFKFSGYMDDVILVNRSISTEEINKLYLGGYQRHGGDLIGWWKFNENTTSGPTLDGGGNGNTGNTSGTTWMNNASCKINGCLSFDGVNDYVNFSTNPVKDNQDYSFSTWFKVNSLPSLNGILVNTFSSDVHQEDFQVRVESDGTLTFWKRTDGSTIDADAVQCVGCIQTGVWYNLVGIYDDALANDQSNLPVGSMKLYLNGNLTVQTPVDTQYNFASQGRGEMQIGIDDSSNSWYFNGIIDNLKFWKRTLTADEAMNEYLANQDQHSIYGNIHRIASAEGLQSVSFNLTDHDSPYQKDYDQRSLLLGVSQIDTTAPVTTVQSPSNTTYSESWVWANVTVSEDVPAVYRSLDSGANVSMTNSSGNWNGNVSGISDGAHTLIFYATDASGNIAAPVGAGFTVSATVSINILNINKTFSPLVPWWVEYVNISGYAAYTNGTPFGSGSIRMNETNGGRETTLCSVSPSPSGSFYCNFTSKYQVGDTPIGIYAISGGTIIGNVTGVMETKPNYGERPAGLTSRSVLETPFPIQEPSSIIRTIVARLTISRGPAGS
ncbi:MAG: LamG domain-containing protein [Candidatus Aenigmarchaeota archaeon]|nr:LamG domain-containing protein [Candidatus Aenigmarchaeota archaeon]